MNRKYSNPKLKIKELKTESAKNPVCSEIVHKESGTTNEGCGQIQPLHYEFNAQMLKIKAYFPTKESYDSSNRESAVGNISILPSVFTNLDQEDNQTEVINTSTSTTTTSSKRKSTGNSNIHNNPDVWATHINPDRILKILRLIDPKDYDILGFNSRNAKPQSFVITHLLVPPPCIRPTNTIVANSKTNNEDWHTQQYAQIVKTNNELAKLIQTNASEEEIEETWQLLQLHVSTIFDSKSFPMKDRSVGNALKRPIAGKSLVQKLGSKTGRIRGTLMGKRNNFFGRTVLIQDPYLKQNEMGIPLYFAKTLTYPELLFERNRDKLQRAVLMGPKKYPGANSFTLPDGRVIELNFCKNPSRYFPLPIGTIVERHLVNGDSVIQGRQPSLHRFSMMAHNAKIYLKDEILGFGMNEKQANPYHADYDGDETNMQPQRSEPGRVEGEVLMQITENVTNPQSNSPIVGFVQDTLLASRLVTHKDTFLTKDQFFECFSQMIGFKGFEDTELPLPAIVKPVPLWTGKQLFSLCVPKNFNFAATSGHHIEIPQEEQNPELDIIHQGDTFVKIQNGDLISGNLCKNSLGTKSSSMISYLFLYYGASTCANFMDVWSRVSLYYISKIRGYTLGPKDFRPEPGQKEKITEILKTANSKIIQMKEEGKLTLTEREGKMATLLDQARAKLTMKTAETLRKRNDNFYFMGGVKGNSFQPSQILNCIGQIQVKNRQRVENGYPGRFSPHFEKGDDSAEARGFIKSNFMSGMEPHEFFVHCKSGINSSIDTTFVTSRTGYIHRRLSRILEEFVVEYDDSVRDPRKNVIQFLYGDEGMDNMRLVLAGFLPEPNVTWKDYSKKYMWRMDDFVYLTFSKITSDQNLQTVIGYHKWFQIINNKILKVPGPTKEMSIEWKRIKSDRNLVEEWKGHLGKFPTPWNFQFLKQSLMKCKDIKEYIEIGLSPHMIAKDVIDLQQKLLKDHPYFDKGMDSCFFVQLRHELYSKSILSNFNPTNVSWRQLLDKIYGLFIKSIINPGEMVGLIAAQSTGEPSTQTSLNTFSFQGNSDQNIQLGVPRLNEIIDASKNTQTPIFSIYLKPKYESDLEIVKHFAKSLPILFLKDVCFADEFTIIDIWDKTNFPKLEDKDWFEDFLQCPDPSEVISEKFDIVSDQWKSHMLDYCVRIPVNPKSIYGITNLAKIVNILRRELSGLNFIYSDMFCSQPAIYLFIRREICLKKKKSNSEPQNQTKKSKSSKSSASVQSLKKDVNLNEEFYTMMPREEQFKLARDLMRSIFEKVTISGIQGVKKCYIRRKVINEQLKHYKYHIDIDGIPSKTRFCFESLIQLPWVDPNRCYNNSTHEMSKIFGIEVARALIIKEIKSFFATYDFYVNPRHLGLMGDVMTWSGRPEGFTRSGLAAANRGAPDVLKKSSFEKAWHFIQTACRNSYFEKIDSITGKIIVGDYPRIGTSMVDLLPKMEV